MKKGEIILDLILFSVVWILINIGLIYIAKKAEKEMEAHAEEIAGIMKKALKLIKKQSQLMITGLYL